MSGDFRLNGVGYSHIHVTIVLTPLGGAAAGLQKTLRTAKSAEYDNNAKVVSIEGPQMAPVQLAPGGAEPTWSVELALGEARQLVAWIGDGYFVIPLDIQCTWQLPGKRAVTDYVESCLIEKDGTKTSSGDAALVTLGGKCRIVRPNGVHPFRLSG